MRILIRADGDRRMGAGHVMRMLALAQQVRGMGGEVTLASARLDDGLALRVEDRGIAVERSGVKPGTDGDCRWVIERATAGTVDWVIVDGYHFDARYQDALAAAGLRQLFVDDGGHCEHYAAEVILNQNASAASELYPRRRDDARLLLGPDYALVRGEFLAAGGGEPAIAARADRILVTMGGADSVNATARVIDALSTVPDADLHVRVIVGPSNPHGRRLSERVTDPRIEVLPASDDMAQEMAWADLAIAGAGGTTYELCFMGTPALLVVLAENQRDLAGAMDREGVCVDLGWHHALEPTGLARTIAAVRGDPARRGVMSRRGRDWIDGRGCTRVIDALYPSGSQ